MKVNVYEYGASLFDENNGEVVSVIPESSLDYYYKRFPTTYHFLGIEERSIEVPKKVVTKEIKAYTEPYRDVPEKLQIANLIPSNSTNIRILYDIEEQS
jgi:hypothetical protein